MLKNISPLFSPELLATIYSMGHGEELVLADAHFPCHQFNDHVIRADGLSVTDLLAAILPLYELDGYAPSAVIMMEAVSGDTLDPAVEKCYLQPILANTELDIEVLRVERFAFYERVKNAHCVVATGDTAKYGNIIIKKGVTPVASGGASE